MNKQYKEFLESKGSTEQQNGFKINESKLNPMLFDWQKELVAWALLKGRGAIFADCGLGKTPMQLDWADQVVKKTNKPVLIVTPLAVSHQTVREGGKFGIDCERSADGKFKKKLVVTNYEKLHYFDRHDFAAVVCDESSAIKHFTGQRQKEVTQFMRHMQYRLLCTATAAPNDYIELGTSSEALGELGRMDMLATFFKNDENSLHPIWMGAKWHFKAHSEQMFWRWVASWARALRKPSDLGYPDADFKLPDLNINEIIVKASRPFRGRLFVTPAVSLNEQREERKLTLIPRCEAAAEKIINGDQTTVAWCHLNAESDLLEKMIPGAVQVQGSDSDESKEEKFLAFTNGELKVLVTKPKIGGFGLNWQHCNYMTTFPSHSFEQYYQSIRRAWRFGQKKPVTVDIITTEGELRVLHNLQRKSKAASVMFDQLVKEMKNKYKLKSEVNLFTKKPGKPKWL